MAVDTLATVADGVTKVIVILSGLLGVIFICWSGIQFITSSGDPQRVAQARMSLFGALIGMVVCGVAFIVPRVVSDLVIEPAGGSVLVVESGTDCDGVLRRHLVVQRQASNGERIQAVVRHIQASREGCGSEVWAPFTWETTNLPNCFERVGGKVVMGGVRVPDGLMWNSMPRRWSSRDADNNIFVYWSTIKGLPTDGSHCWMYVSQHGAWAFARGEFDVLTLPTP